MRFDKRTGRPLLDHALIGGLLDICRMVDEQLDSNRREIDDPVGDTPADDALRYIRALVRWHDANPKRRNR